MLIKKCEICGAEVKNLGVHIYHAHKGNLKPEIVNLEEFTEKPLSNLISSIKDILKSYRYELDIRLSEREGRQSEIEIRARIQV